MRLNPLLVVSTKTQKLIKEGKPRVVKLLVHTARVEAAVGSFARKQYMKRIKCYDINFSQINSTAQTFAVGQVHLQPCFVQDQSHLIRFRICSVKETNDLG